MDGKLKIHITAIALIIFILAAGEMLASSMARKAVLYVSGFGMLAVLSLFFVFSIPMLARRRRAPITLFLLANRRWIGIYVFVFALIHIALVFHFFFSWDISKLLNHPNSLFLSLGSLSFLILAAMAATSTDWAMKTLGKHWKTLQNLAYVALVLALVHAFKLGLVFMSQIAIAAAIILLGAFFLVQKIRHTKLI